MKTSMEVVSTIVDYIDDHLGRKLDLERVAEAADFSK